MQHTARVLMVGAGGLGSATLEATGELTGFNRLLPGERLNFLVPGPRYWYATVEADPGEILVLDIPATGPAQIIQRVGTAGAYPCHLAVLGNLVVATNYNSGSVSALPVLADGTLGSATVFTHEGSGPNPDRQEAPHTHFVTAAPGADPTRPEHFLVVDLGTDEIVKYQIFYPDDDAPVTVTPAGTAAQLPAGAGPRHLDFDPESARVYVSGELDGKIHVLDWDVTAVTGTHVAEIDCKAPGRGDRPAQPSHIEIVGDRVLMGVRGTERIASVALKDYSDLQFLDLEPGWIRHFSPAGEFTLVSQQEAGEIHSYNSAGEVVGRVALDGALCTVITRL